MYGPRPYLLIEKEEIGNYYNEIIKIKPGITGKWQISGRNNINFKDRIKIDYEYCKKENLFEDAKIIILTFIQVIKRDGAL